MGRSRYFDLDHAAAAKAPPRPAQSAGPGGARGQRGEGGPHPAGQALLALQRQYGNQYVQEAVIQAKLVVGAPRDRCEREADRVAQAVVRGTTGSGWRGVQSVGRAPGPAPLRARGLGAAGGPGAPGLQQNIQQARGRGQALPEDVRAPMEQALGADLTDVRLHTDSAADRLSRSLQARAFTSGRDIFLRRGQAGLTSPAGRELIAHELTHVAQQAGGGGTGEGAVQRKLWQISPDRVYDDVLNLTATRKTGFPHVFVGDTDALDYEIVPDGSGQFKLQLGVPGFGISATPSGWSLAGTQGFTAPPTWGPLPVERGWDSPGGKTNYSLSPGGTAYQQGAKKQGQYGKYPNRVAAGFVNPGQFDVAMLPLWRNAVVGPMPTGLSYTDEVKWLQDPLREFMVRDSFTSTKKIKSYQRTTAKGKVRSAVVLGHSTSAGQLFNLGGHGQPPGHKRPRQDNYNFNQTAAPFHGLEDYSWSSKSAKFDPKYVPPRPDQDSDRTYWDPTDTNFTGGPWHSYNRVADTAMISYIQSKLAKVPTSKQDSEWERARIELALLRTDFTNDRVGELLSTIKAKGW